MYLFGHLKGQKWKKLLNISKTVFYKQILDFTFQNFMPHIEIMKFYQNHWSLIRGQFFMNSNLHFQAPAHLILKIINYFFREQVSDPDPHSVSYWYRISFETDPGSVQAKWCQSARI